MTGRNRFILIVLTAIAFACFLNISATTVLASGTINFTLEILPISSGGGKSGEELAAKSISSIKQEEIAALPENSEQRSFIKNIGSNLRLAGQKLFLNLKNFLY